jgi:plasmid maintenance system antidote protein VapI
MKKTTDNIEQQLRRAIRSSGLSVNAIAKATGVPQSTLSRFVAETTTINLAGAAKVAALFEMRFTEPKKPAGKNR